MSDEEDFSALFDEQPATPKRQGRPRTRDIYPDPAATLNDEQMRAFYRTPEGQRRIRSAATGRTTEVSDKDFLQPVGAAFIAKVLRLNAETVRRRLETVTPVGHAHTSQNRPLYDFASVVPYLVKPKMDLRTYLRSLNPADMPISVNKSFWEAERIRNKTLLETGEAWPTEAVLERLGQVFMMIKDRMPLLTEALRDEGLTDDQMLKLQAACDQFQKDLHEALVELPKQQSTPSRLAEVGLGIEEGEVA